jgi:ABC-type lipoprotein release transport system permease subunit
VGLGFGGAALISWLAPTLYAAVASSPGSQPPQGMTVDSQAGGAPSVQQFDAPDSTHTVPIHLSAHVTVGVVVLAVVLAIAGGLLAGLLGGWRAARLRPAEALARVE